VVVYNGFDATADSLHIGHLVPLLALARLQRFGHHAIALAGGGTSMIGDPSGKTAERRLLTLAEIEANVVSIKKQLAQFLDFEVKTNPARVLNNADWLVPLKLVDFLRDTGKHFTVNYMTAKDSVKTRLDREDGISFTEFSYMLLQSYDFLHLFEHQNCQLQTGGSDQWGNITAGVELIRRKGLGSAYGMVYPLVTKADGSSSARPRGLGRWLRSAPHPISSTSSAEHRRPGCGQLLKFSPDRKRSISWPPPGRGPSSARRSAAWPSRSAAGQAKACTFSRSLAGPVRRRNAGADRRRNPRDLLARAIQPAAQNRSRRRWSLNCGNLLPQRSDLLEG
jgi:hypothetical protein